MLATLWVFGCVGAPEERTLDAPRPRPGAQAKLPVAPGLSPASLLGHSLVTDADTLSVQLPAVVAFWAPWLPSAEAYLQSLAELRARVPEYEIYLAMPPGDDQMIPQGLTQVQTTDALKNAVGGVWSLPTAIVAGPEGAVHYRQVGPLDPGRAVEVLTAVGLASQQPPRAKAPPDR